MARNFLITLTVADQYSTYSVYYDNISINNFCTIISNGQNADNIPYSQFLGGLKVTSPIDTLTQIIIVNNQCKTQVSIPIKTTTPTPITPNLCVQFTTENTPYDSLPWTFTPNGTANGRNKWSYTHPTLGQFNITWNLTAGQWELPLDSRTTLFFPTNTTTPTGTWQSTAPSVYNISVTEGSCTPQTLPIISSVVAEPTNCRNVTPCSGSVVITANNGTPPYEYAVTTQPNNPSILNWSTSNIIQNLCEGTFSAVVRDSLGNLSQPSSFNITYNSVGVTYNISINVLSTQIIEDSQQPVRKIQAISEWEVNVTPQLQPGVVLKFSLDITNQVTKYSPLPSIDGDGTVITSVYIADVISSSLTTSTFSDNILNPVCQGEVIDISGNTMSYSFEYNEDSIVSGTSYTKLEVNQPVTNRDGCTTNYQGFTEVRLTPNSRLSIIGCDCCNAIYDNRLFLVLNESTNN